ncbi:hypothetical protein ANCCAN_08330 [Ancylostoma caninum]|uniref:Uncharacterized protein n=1 Tax=Ancylostoma caninum TaxID=29170 RepID=A0A368GMR6_ANCCA|nr:hypothetical protein ANCCAN_08330 [Ancylostoma caninum]
MRMASVVNRGCTELGSQFHVHHASPQNFDSRVIQVFLPISSSHSSVSNASKDAAENDRFNSNMRKQQSLELLSKSNVLSYSQAASSLTKSYSSNPSSATIYHPFAHTYNVPKKKAKETMQLYEVDVLEAVLRLLCKWRILCGL